MRMLGKTAVSHLIPYLAAISANVSSTRLTALPEAISAWPIVRKHISSSAAVFADSIGWLAMAVCAISWRMPSSHRQIEVLCRIERRDNPQRFWHTPKRQRPLQPANLAVQSNLARANLKRQL